MYSISYNRQSYFPWHFCRTEKQFTILTMLFVHMFSYHWISVLVRALVQLAARVSNIKAILHYTSFARAGKANLWEHKTFRALWRSRTRHGSRNVFYFHGVPASATAYGNSYACVFLRMLLQVRSARAGETGVMENRLNMRRTDHIQICTQDFACWLTGV